MQYLIDNYYEISTLIMSGVVIILSVSALVCIVMAVRDEFK